MENKQDLIKKLNSHDIALVKEAIETIKQEEDLSIVPDLLDLLLDNPKAEIISLVTPFLSDIKNSSFKQMLMEKLINASNNSAKANLLRICWESAIDFSEHFQLFIDILIEDDFMAALEAYTVMENLSGNISDEDIQNAIRRLKQQQPTDDKTFLIEDAINHLEKLLLQMQEQEEEFDDADNPFD